MLFSKILKACKSTNTIHLCSKRLCSVNANKLINPKNDIEEKLLKVAIIGLPNAGKSTFINSMMDRKVCATSSKAHTTRAKCKAIFTEDDTQIIFLDTPGLVNVKDKNKFDLEKSFSKDYKTSLQEAYVIGVIHDVSNVHTQERLDMKVISVLKDFKKKPSFLILNKIDLLKSKRKLLDITRLITESSLNGKLMPNVKPLKQDPDGNRGWPHFQEVFMVSSLTGNGLTEIRNYLIKNAQPGKWLFPENIWSDQTAETIIVNSVKGKLLDFLPQEIPYRLKTEIEYLEIENTGVIKTIVNVHCPSNRIANLIAGANNGRMKQIISSVQSDLQDTFHNYVRINIRLDAPSEKGN